MALSYLRWYGRRIGAALLLVTGLAGIAGAQAIGDPIAPTDLVIAGPPLPWLELSVSPTAANAAHNLGGVTFFAATGPGGSILARGAQQPALRPDRWLAGFRVRGHSSGHLLHRADLRDRRCSLGASSRLAPADLRDLVRRAAGHVDSDADGERHNGDAHALCGVGRPQQLSSRLPAGGSRQCPWTHRHSDVRLAVGGVQQAGRAPWRLLSALVRREPLRPRADVPRNAHPRAGRDLRASTRPGERDGHSQRRRRHGLVDHASAHRTGNHVPRDPGLPGLA